MLFFYSVLLLVYIIYCDPLKCYGGIEDLIKEVECPANESDYCIWIEYRGQVQLTMYGCNTGICTKVGCEPYKEEGKEATVCCCDTNLCNAKSTSTSKSTFSYFASSTSTPYAEL